MGIVDIATLIIILFCVIVAVRGIVKNKSHCSGCNDCSGCVECKKSYADTNRVNNNSKK